MPIPNIVIGPKRPVDDVSDQFPIGTKVQLRADLHDHMRELGLPVNALQHTRVAILMKQVGEVVGYDLDASVYDSKVAVRVRVKFPEDGGREPILRPSFLVKVEAPAKKRLHDSCPKCGNPGRFVLMALTCPVHGVWAGC
jgi:hypothetical protein